MSTKIIVGVDDAERSKDAVALATALARGSGAEILLVSAYPYDEHPSRALNAEYERALRADAEAALARLREEAPDPAIVTTCAVADVSPARALQTVAERAQAALIVLASSRRGAVGRVLAGTTTERLLHGAPCPVAVAPRHFAQRIPAFATIAVGYDGEPEAAAALRAAVALARGAGARLRVIEVVEALWLGTPALMGGPGYIETPEHHQERADAWLAKVVAGLPAEVDAEPLVIMGTAERELADQSELADLMVVGSRGYGPHAAVLLGSVSGRLVRDAACPVIVVPRGIESPLAALFPAARTQLAQPRA